METPFQPLCLLLWVTIFAFVGQCIYASGRIDRRRYLKVKNLNTAGPQAPVTAFKAEFPTSVDTTTRRFQKRTWKPVTVSLLVAGPAYYYYSTRVPKRQTFEFSTRVKGPDGKVEMVKRQEILLPLSEVDKRVRANETSERKVRPGGIIWRHTTATLASNDPIEDANSHAIVEREASDPSAPGDLLFFTVMDGHGGKHTSQVLSKVLINAVALELSNMIKGNSDGKTQSLLGLADGLKAYLRPSETPTVLNPPKDVPQAIEEAFTKLDTELISAPLRVLANNLDAESKKNKLIPDLSKHPLALTTMLPAVSGSCALMALFDTANRDLYVACSGDSRAVAGVWEKSENGTGVWRVEVLSEDQTGRNPNELKRIQSEHPSSEASHVIREGRILGGLEPSRAFGDARYKWSREVQETLNQAFMVGNGRPLRSPPSTYLTPPYVTARPVITHRKLDFLLPEQRANTDDANSTLRFLVLATDGLWDQLTSEEVVSLVGGHLAGLKGTLSKDELSKVVPTFEGSPTVEGKDKKSARTEQGSWAFVDDNISAHLIRNAFGGGDEDKLRRLFSIPAPYSRRFRDDVTVTVVWWEDGSEETAKSSTFAKAKL